MGKGYGGSGFQTSVFPALEPSARGQELACNLPIAISRFLQHICAMKALCVAALLPFAVVCPAQQQDPAAPMKVASQEARAHLQIRITPEYPETGIANRIQNNELLRIVIDEEGRVVEAAVQAGHPAFAQESLAAVKQWRYRPFLLNDQAVRVETIVLIAYLLPGAEDAAPLPPPNAVISCVVTPSLQPGQARVHVDRDVIDKHRKKYVAPTYPPMARIAHIQGEVVLSAVIDKQGYVTKLRAVSGHPILVQAALDAARQWAYEPYLINGEPVEVDSMIHVVFELPAATRQ
jgi:TonB family protein